MQDLKTGEFRDVSVLVSSFSEAIRFAISESSRYTTTITIAQQMPAGIRDLMLVVRAYHDVQCAEVISFQGQRQFAEKLVYPKDKMRAPDEKAQVNRLLGELLTLCQERSHLAIQARQERTCRSSTERNITTSHGFGIGPKRTS